MCPYKLDENGDIFIPQEVIDDFAPMRAQIQKAIDAQPKSVTLEQVLKQVESFGKHFVVKRP